MADLLAASGLHTGHILLPFIYKIHVNIATDDMKIRPSSERVEIDRCGLGPNRFPCRTRLYTKCKNLF